MADKIGSSSVARTIQASRDRQAAREAASRIGSSSSGGSSGRVENVGGSNVVISVRPSTTSTPSSSGGSNQVVVNSQPQEVSYTSPILNRAVTQSEISRFNTPEARASFERSLASQRQQEADLVRSGITPFEQASSPVRRELENQARQEQDLVRSGVAVPVRPATPPSPVSSRPLVAFGSSTGRENLAKIGGSVVRFSNSEGVVQDVVFTGVAGQEASRDALRGAGRFLESFQTTPIQSTVKAVVAPAVAVAFPNAAVATPVFIGANLALRRGIEVTRDASERPTAFSSAFISNIREEGVRQSQIGVRIPFTSSEFKIPLSQYRPGGREQFEEFVRARTGGNEAVVQRLVGERRVVTAGQIANVIGAEVVGEATGQGLLTGSVLKLGGRLGFSGTTAKVKRESAEFARDALFPAGFAEATSGFVGSSALSTGELPSFSTTVGLGFVGGGSAALIGGRIVSQQAVGERSVLPTVVNILEPAEPVGDVAFAFGQFVRRQSGGVTFQTGIRRSVGGVEFVAVPRVRSGSFVVDGFVPSTSTPNPTPSPSPSSSSSVFDSGLVPTPSSSIVPSVSSRTSVFVPSPSRSLSRSGSRSGVPSVVPNFFPSLVPSPVPSRNEVIVPTRQDVLVPSRTPANTFVPAFASVPSKVPTYTPPPFLLPRGDLGVGGARGSGGGQKTSRKGAFAPDFTAAFFGQRAGKSTGRVRDDALISPLSRRLI